MSTVSKELLTLFLEKHVVHFKLSEVCFTGIVSFPQPVVGSTLSQMVVGFFSPAWDEGVEAGRDLVRGPGSWPQGLHGLDVLGPGPRA